MSEKVSKAEVKEIVVARLLEAMEKGVCPWRKPWKSVNTRPCNISGRKYSGINWFILTMMPYVQPVFMTFKQAQAMGGNVKKGEKGIPVVFWKMLVKEDKATGTKETIPMMRYYTVFNIEQTEGVTLPKKFAPREDGPEFNPIAAAEAIWDGMPNRPTVKHGGDRASYLPPVDEIHMPNRADFTVAEEYYSTLFHEGSHSTGHKSRLNRKEVMGAICFGSMDYSLEELVAEMSAAMLCAEAGIDAPVLENSAAYLRSWYAKLSKDPGMLITAAARAQKAADYILNPAKDETPQDETEEALAHV